MTIPTSTPVRAFADRLHNLERCAEEAPERTYLRANAAVNAINTAAEAVRDAFKTYGFAALGDDRARVVDAVLYWFLLTGNPDEPGLITGEGFGEAMDGPEAARVLAQATSYRDALDKCAMTQAEYDAAENSNR